MRELVVISGKGGTGKTSVVASFAALAENHVLADCDVDAADLHLVLQPETRERHEFRSGNEARINPETCTGCCECLTLCRFGAVHKSVAAGRVTFSVEPASCEGCGVCVDNCPAGAIDFPERIAGEWFISDTRHGPMVHARLGAAAENSGKLVSLVRREAKRLSGEQGRELILVDGPPGIGCPVIASVTGASMVLIVTEPTLSGRHDLLRVAELARHFRVPAAACVNKWDLNPAMSGAIEEEARGLGVTPVGRIRYDRAVTAAQVAGKSLVEYSENGAASDLRRVWNSLHNLLITA
ncbi:MAG: ATP-binding protein [Candidatus Hydrogenedentes bacterium]|nr:ATP-binding protein [Candidatus Hydrogenedentota bacterium]